MTVGVRCCDDSYAYPVDLVTDSQVSTPATSDLYLKRVTNRAEARRLELHVPPLGSKHRFGRAVNSAYLLFAQSKVRVLRLSGR
jgi:hypothetical protein